MNAIDRTFNEMLNDDDDRDDQGERLERIYNEASDAEKARLNDAFVCLCGWSLQTIIDFEK